MILTLLGSHQPQIIAIWLFTPGIFPSFVYLIREHDLKVWGIAPQSTELVGCIKKM